MLQKPLKDLRTAGHWEGVSYLLLLFVAMPLKYFAGMPMAVRVAGSIHGFLFILFLYYIYHAMKTAGLPKSKALRAFILSFIPFGTFYMDKFVFLKK